MFYLLKKTRRDLWQYKVQFISVFLMAFLSVLIYVGIEGFWFGMETYSDKWFKLENTADAWVSGNMINESNIESVKNLDGVNEAQGVTLCNANLKVPDNEGKIQLLAIDENIISKPTIIKGKEYNCKENGIWLSQEFAKKHSVEIGDKISISCSNQNMELEVKGILLSSEYMYYSGSTTTPLPDRYQYGYAYVSEKTIQTLLGNSGDVFYNEIRILYDGELNKKEISTLREDLEDLLVKQYKGYYTHSDFTGVSNCLEAMKSFQTNSIMFSTLFIILSICTISATMKRIVGKQRVMIGTFKALGYSDSLLRLHYALYGLFISGLGCICGYFVAPYTVAEIIIFVEKDYYSIFEWKPDNSLISFVIMIILTLCCTLTAYLTSLNATKGMPINAMNKEVPKRKKMILLERIPFIWESLSYESRRVIREVLRRKGATFMGILAVGGSLTLLITGFGTSDSLSKTNKIVYGQQLDYESKIVLNSAISEEEREQLLEKITGNYQWIEEEFIELETSKIRKNTVVQIYEEKLFTHFKSKEGKKIQLPQNGIALSEGFATKNGLQVGDTVQIRINGESDFVITTIKKIINSYAPQGLYISQASWEKMKKTFSPNILLTDLSELPKDITNLPFVQETTTLDEQLNSADKVVDSMLAVVIILLLASIALSIVILCDLGLLSYSEKYVEYATQKVLGYTDSEIQKLIIGELIIQVFAGILVGIPSGYLFLHTFVNSFATTNFEYITYITPGNLILSLFVVIGCTIATNLIVALKIKNVDMVEALKAVD